MLGEADEFVALVRVTDVPPGTARRVSVRGRVLAVWHTAEGFFVTDDTCTHEKASLSEGDFDPEEGVVACPRHGARFNVRTGKALSLPAYRPVAVYPVRVTGNQVVEARIGTQPTRPGATEQE